MLERGESYGKGSKSAVWTSELEYLNPKFCKIIAQVHWLMGPLADRDLSFNPKLMSLLVTPSLLLDPGRLPF